MERLPYFSASLPETVVEDSDDDSDRENIDEQTSKHAEHTNHAEARGNGLGRELEDSALLHTVEEGQNQIPTSSYFLENEDSVPPQPDIISFSSLVPTYSPPESLVPETRQIKRSIFPSLSIASSYYIQLLSSMSLMHRTDS